MSDHRLFDEPQSAKHTTSGQRQQVRGRVTQTRRSALWAAYGDALGFISELTDAAGLRRRTRGRELTVPVEWKRRIGGRGGINATLPAGCYSDDTQLRLATARAIGPQGFDVEAFASVELPVWLAYALGGGVSTKAAATNLAKTRTAWFSNTYQGWLDAGGNGAAMRIQPHVWATPKLNEPDGYMSDVFRNAVCTHAHPTALIGATLHALTLAYSMSTGSLAEPSMLTKLVDDAGMVPSMLRDDAQLGELWLTGWERAVGRPFDDAWQSACRDAREAIAAAERAFTRASGPGRYDRVIDTLKLMDPDRRGSGLLTAVAAVVVTWCDEQPAEALAASANVVGSDTDTIATMAGALLGAVASDEPAVDVMDGALIATEAARMAELAGGARHSGHPYPDLLSWTAPRTQADALLSDRDGLHVAGLGRIRRTLGQSMPARQGSFQWQWAELEYGQTILIKRRNELPAVRNQESTNPQSSHAQGRDTAERKQRDRLLDLETVIEWVNDQQDNNAAIGYAIRRVANEATPEQTAAFFVALLQILRRRADEG